MNKTLVTLFCIAFVVDVVCACELEKILQAVSEAKGELPFEVFAKAWIAEWFIGPGPFNKFHTTYFMVVLSIALVTTGLYSVITLAILKRNKLPRT